jgi:hypothetical protein
MRVGLRLWRVGSGRRGVRAGFKKLKSRACQSQELETG